MAKNTKRLECFTFKCTEQVKNFKFEMVQNGGSDIGEILSGPEKSLIGRLEFDLGKKCIFELERFRET